MNSYWQAQQVVNLPFTGATVTFYWSEPEWQQPDPNAAMVAKDDRPETERERWHRQARECDARTEKLLAAIAEHDKTAPKQAISGLYRVAP